MNLPPLPIDEVCPEALQALRERRGLVLSAPPGTGKTTRFPARMLADGLFGRKKVLLIEPRRVAARAAARRIAWERQSPLGDEVGYHVRLDRKVGPRTRLIAMTPGILVRQLMNDPFLEDVACVLFDEAHERGLELDLALAMVQLARTTLRNDLAVGILSATLETERFAAWLDAPVVQAQSPLFPVEIRYTPLAKDRPWLDQVARQIRFAAGETTHDILVFLPGIGEINRLEKQLRDQLPREILPLHGELDPTRQDLALSGGTTPRVILATNVAESSVTVNGVDLVIDTGFARELVNDPASGLDRLERVEISRASADQRAGRAGRQGPGLCIRLWSVENHTGRAERNTPEIQKIDLSSAVLTLLAWDGCSIEELPWLEPPPAASLSRAKLTLEQLGATKKGHLTDLGKRMAQLPMQPRLARMMVAAADESVPGEGAIAAALLAERDPFGRNQRGPVDFFQEIDSIRWESGWPGASDHGLSLPHGEFQRIDRLAALFLAQANLEGSHPSETWEEGLARAMIAGFPDRVARLREGSRTRGLMVGARGVRLEQELPGRGDLFLALDLEDSQMETRVRKYLPLESTWLPSEQINETVQVSWNSEKTEILARKQIRFLDLVLKEHTVPPDDPAEVSRLLAERAWEKRTDFLPSEESPAGQFLLRLGFLSRHCPELELPCPDEEFLKTILGNLTAGVRSLNHLAEADWLGALQGALEWKDRQVLDAEAPARLTMPNGRTSPILYQKDGPPVLAARLQDFFGWDETPLLARKRVKCLLHLLAPSGRPQQITDDLHGFWRGSYALVRKEMKGRYPKHSWPEDPWNAEPILRGPGRPRS